MCQLFTTQTRHEVHAINQRQKYLRIPKKNTTIRIRAFKYIRFTRYTPRRRIVLGAQRIDRKKHHNTQTHIHNAKPEEQRD